MDILRYVDQMTAKISVGEVQFHLDQYTQKAANKEETAEWLREKLRPSVFLLESTILTKKVHIHGNFSTP